MVYSPPRYEPISGGDQSHHSADTDWSAGFGGVGAGGGNDRGAGLVARASFAAYRLNVLIISAIAFSAGTGFTIYSAITGR